MTQGQSEPVVFLARLSEEGPPTFPVQALRVQLVDRQGCALVRPPSC
jgi:hypothetical protein